MTAQRATTGRETTASEGDLGPEDRFLASLREGVLRLQRCTETGRYLFYPRAISPYSGRPTLEWTEASGEGVVYSSTVVRRKPEQGGDYNVALVDLNEGVRMMSRVEGVAPSDVRIGMPVRARIDATGSRPVVVFVPVES